MSGDIAAAGDVITGALAARAVEPNAGEGGGHGNGLCLNCGTRLIGSHCHACGQSAHIHRTIGAIGHEIAHGVFHFEGKIWRTLPLLILRPGELTRRYVAGERARFVSPLALFLFTVFLMFATINAVGGDWTDMVGQGTARSAAAIDRNVKETQKQLGVTKAERDARAKAGQPTKDFNDQIADQQRRIGALQGAAKAITPEQDYGLSHAQTGWLRLDHGLKKVGENPSLALYKLQSSAYKYSWLLIPISTPFVALLFLWRRRFGMYDHAIFVTYSLSFMMLLVITVTWFAAWGVPNGIWTSMFAFWPPIHMFQQLRGAYSLRKRSALWRTFMLSIFAALALTCFAILLVLHGLAE